MIDREILEQKALEAVCPCQFYELTDCIEGLTDADLIDIIQHKKKCEICGK